MELIGQGMEGAVYDLGNGLVRKLWFERRPEEVLPLEAFLAEVPELPFRTPRIRAVRAGDDGLAVSDEDLLTGTPFARTDPEVFVSVVQALGTTTAGSAARALPVLGEPFGASWGAGLAALVRRRAEASYEHLVRDVADFPQLVEEVAGRLEALEVEHLSIVHGDICPENVLMDGSRVSALIDWGFLSTAGDNTFDAALAAGFYDMYGPDARRYDALLLDRFEALGHDRGRMHLYRQAYAIITATIYDEHAGDGHYQWCVADLKRATAARRC